MLLAGTAYNLGWACSCSEMSVREAYDSGYYAYVFAGTVISGETTVEFYDISSGDTEERVTEVHVQVDTVWNGLVGADVRMAGDRSMCGPFFEQGKRYLIFASDSEDGAGKIKPAFCATRQVLFEDPVLEELPEPYARFGSQNVDPGMSLEHALNVLAVADGPGDRLIAWAVIRDRGAGLTFYQVLMAASDGLDSGAGPETHAAAGLLIEHWDESAADRAYPLLRRIVLGSSRAAAMAVLEFLEDRDVADWATLTLFQDALRLWDYEEAAFEGWAWLMIEVEDAELIEAVVLPFVEELLNSEDPRHRSAAATALWFLPETPASLVALLSPRPGEEAEEPFDDAIEALANAGSHGVEPLRALLRSRNASTRSSAASNLGKMGADARSALSDLRVAAADEESPEVRGAAARAIEGISPGSGWPLYREWRESGDDWAADEFLRYNYSQGVEEELSRLLGLAKHREFAIQAIKSRTRR